MGDDSEFYGRGHPLCHAPSAVARRRCSSARAARMTPVAPTAASSSVTASDVIKTAGLARMMRAVA